MSVENCQCKHGTWLYEFCEECFEDELIYNISHIDTKGLETYVDYRINKYLYENKLKDIAIRKKKVKKGGKKNDKLHFRKKV